jgi:RNAse (barnase) inhibitor barstar
MRRLITPGELHKQLMEAVEVVAATAEAQQQWCNTHGYPVDEIPQNLEDCVPAWFSRLTPAGMLDDRVRAALLELNSFFGVMRERSKPILWQYQGLGEPEWAEARRRASTAIALMRSATHGPSTMTLVLLHFAAAWAEATCVPHRSEVEAAAQQLGATVKVVDVDRDGALWEVYRPQNVPAVALEQVPASLLVGAHGSEAVVPHMERYVRVIDGARFDDLAGFYEEVSSYVIPGASWGRNLDAFNDILRGGFGTPDGGFQLHWMNSDLSLENLSWAETIRFIENKRTTCHPDNVSHIEQDLEGARRREGDTLFDTLVGIVMGHGPGGREKEDGVILFLE